MLNGIRQFLNAKDVVAAIKKTLDENADLRKQVEAQMKERLLQIREKLVGKVEQMGDIKVVKAVMPTMVTPDGAKDLAFQLSGMMPDNMLCVLGTSHEGKPLLTVMISKNLIADKNLNAGNLVREAAKLIKGGGGGAPHFATAGGKDVEGLSAAVDKVVELALA